MIKKYTLPALFFIMLMLFSINNVFAEENDQYKVVKKSLVTGEVTTEIILPSKVRTSRPVTPAYIPEISQNSNMLQEAELSATSGSRHYVKPNAFPYTAIGQLSMTFKTPNGSVQGSTGTAFLEGPDVLFTAAHCVYSAAWGG